MLVSRSVCSMHDVSVRRVHVFHFWVLRGTFWIFTCHFSSASLEGKEKQICLNNGSWCCQISRKSSETLKFCMCVCVSPQFPVFFPWYPHDAKNNPLNLHVPASHSWFSGYVSTKLFDLNLGIGDGEKCCVYWKMTYMNSVWTVRVFQVWCSDYRNVFASSSLLKLSHYWRDPHFCLRFWKQALFATTLMPPFSHLSCHNPNF